MAYYVTLEMSDWGQTNKDTGFFCILRVSCHNMSMLQSRIVDTAVLTGYGFSYAHDTNCLRLWSVKLNFCTRTNRCRGIYKC